MSTAIVNTIEIKTSTLNHTKMRLRRPCVTSFIEQIQQISDKAPKLLARSHIIIDFSLVQKHQFTKPDLLAIKTAVLQTGAYLLGIQNVSSALAHAAQQLSVSVIHESPQKRPTAMANSITPPLLLERVRGGCEVHSDSDLVVLGHVGHGSSISANGNIYVYGTLSGKAFFGLKSKGPCHLIAQTFDPELVGSQIQYLTNNQLDSNIKGKQICCTSSPSSDTLTFKTIEKPPYFHG